MATAGFLHLSDEVWLHIGSYLDALSLIACSQSQIPGLSRIALDQNLWTHVLILPKNPRRDLSKANLRQVVSHLGSHTRSLIVRGTNSHFGKRRPKGAKEVVSSPFMYSVKLHCVNLRRLGLEYLTVDIHSGFMKLIPKSVRYFSLEGTHITNLPVIRTTVISPLFKIHQNLPALQELNLVKTDSWSILDDLLGPIKSKTVQKIRLTHRTLNRAPEGHWNNTYLNSNSQPLQEILPRNRIRGLRNGGAP